MYCTNYMEKEQGKITDDKSASLKYRKVPPNVSAVLLDCAGGTPAVRLSFIAESLLTFVEDVRGSAGSYTADTEIAYL